MTSLSRWGSSDLPVIKPFMSQGPNIGRVNESNRRTQKPNLMLLNLELKISSMMSLSAQGRTKEKDTMERKNSSVLIAGRDSTLNMPT